MSYIRIVIVDDSEADRYIASRYLEKDGGFLPIIEVPSGYQFLSDFLPELKKLSLADEKLIVLMDINMPRIDGFETVDALQSHIRNGDIGENIAVMMFTSSDNPRDRTKALQFPLIKGYIVKPLNKEGVQSIHQLYRSISP